MTIAGQVRLLADCWDGIINREEVITDPSNDDLIRLFDRLDQQRHTILSIDSGTGASLTVGGGNGKYVVYACEDDVTFFNLISDDDSRQLARLNAGGQEGEYPGRQVVNGKAALTAAQTFLSLQLRDSSLCWEAG